MSCKIESFVDSAASGEDDSGRIELRLPEGETEKLAEIGRLLCQSED